MNGVHFSTTAFINKVHSVKTHIDAGCGPYGLIDQRVARRLQLDLLPLDRPMGIAAWDDNMPAVVASEVAIIEDLDVAGSRPMQRRVFLYVVPRLDGHHEIMLGQPWMEYEDAVINQRTNTMTIRRTGITVSNINVSEKQHKIMAISGVSFVRESRRKNAHVFSASLADIEKALRVKEHTDPRVKLPKMYWKHLDTFDKALADILPPLRGPGIDHSIELLKKEDGTEQQAPWGPLYSMSRDELLVLRKTLTEHLDKGFIRASNSPAAAPVLFVRKPGGGLRFCVDYRRLNQITRKDRYPLPLIRETLNNIRKAKWFTKLDVIAAFNKLRIAQGDEWKTAFRTRYGLFEWLVMPFGLANAPSAFQRYVNWVLREYLDDFVSAYVDDILIYTDGTLAEHQAHVHKVLERMGTAGLQLDIDKCEFHVQSTKYLGFIIEAGKGIRMDPEKIKAIMEWEEPSSVKGVRSFIGFVNFYRQFIDHFSSIAAPLTRLMSKENATPLILESNAREAFYALKAAITVAPVLMQFDPERRTILECDASNWGAGCALIQLDESGLKHPVAFFSKKFSPAECNYDVHDKELLAIILGLTEWEPELIGLETFTILTDHKNLEYFLEQRRLNPRQFRWYLKLSRFNFQLEYRPGKYAGVPDALSRREQDKPHDGNDERLKYREIQVFKSQRDLITRAAPVDTQQPEPESLQDMLTSARTADMRYQDLCKAVREETRLPPESCKPYRVSMGELRLNHASELLWRERMWIPESEPLRTKIIQSAHDSVLIGHPGKEGLSRILRRDYHWPGMHNDIKQFVRNCHSCGRNSVWRDRYKGCLKPLPVPMRIWSEISMDYITDLPLTKRGNRHILVIVDRLSKGVFFEPVPDLEGRTLAQRFIQRYLPIHLLPEAITSDRGDQFVHGVWGHICDILKISKRLSTAYHPQTDGQTERMNTVVEEYIRHFTTHEQDDWDELLPMAQAAVMARDATSTGFSPFYLSHGYHPRIGAEVEITGDPVQTASDPKEAAQAITKRIQDAMALAQTLMDDAQQRQEDITNRKRDPAPTFRVGDKVWLDLRNIRIDRPKKKLAPLHAIYRVTEAISSHAYRLDVPNGEHDVFHVSLLRPVSEDPLPSQVQDDVQPPPVIVEGEEEWSLDEILDHRVVRGRGRGGPLKRQFRCRWHGYAEDSWHDQADVEDSIALDQYEERLGKKISEEPLALTTLTRPKRRRRGVM